MAVFFFHKLTVVRSLESEVKPKLNLVKCKKLENVCGKKHEGLCVPNSLYHILGKYPLKYGAQMKSAVSHCL